MAKVIFEDENLSVDVEDGASLKDATDKAKSSLPFGCVKGECGTCLIEVLEGMENLSPLTEDEDITLSEEEISANYRLACQCKVTSGSVKIQPADELE